MRTVLVTGGTTRLGKVIAEHLATVGWRVLTTSHRSDVGADFTADLSDPAGPAKLYAAVLDRLGGNPPDALVNNAALFAGTEEELVRLNFEAPKKLTMLMAGRETGIGSVVNVLDTRVLGEKTDDEGPYAAAKRRLLDYTRSSAALYVDSLRVNGVAPGPVLVPTSVHEKAGQTPLGRPTPEAVAEAVAFLLSAVSTTGAVLPVDGGQWVA